MSTLAFGAVLFFIAILIASKIPGLEHFVKPVIDLLFYFIKGLLENSWAWCIFIVKSLWTAHSFLFDNLIHRAEDIDPSIGIK